MTFEERIQQINRLDWLISRKYRGNASDYARKMNLSRSAFFRLLEYTRTELNAPIYYCKHSSCYCYSENGKLFVGFLKEEELQKINGGEMISKNNVEKFPFSLNQWDYQPIHLK